MPELPGVLSGSLVARSMYSELVLTLGRLVVAEVERAARLLRDLAQGKTVTAVDAIEDTIVFAGITYEEFVGLVAIIDTGPTANVLS